MASRDVRLVVRDLNFFTERSVKMLTFEAHANWTEDCPVDTGWARASIVPEIGKAFEGQVGTQEGARLGNIDLAPSQSGLARVASSYRLRHGPVFITWAIPYGGKLNDGSSTKAPSGFVQKAIAKAVTTVTRSGPPQLR